MEKEDKKNCGVCEIPYFERNNYYYGKLMTVRDFFKEQCYFNEKRWLINRMINGWGVVCGLDVKRKPIDPNDLSKGYDDKKVVVTPGLAIDCCGREILVCEEQEVVVPEKPECHQGQRKQLQEQQGEGEKKEKRYIICLEYHECKTEPVNLPPIACDQKERSEFNHIRDGFKKIYAKLESECKQPPCGKICPLENKSIAVHEYLCNKLEEGCPECPDCPCVILATVTVDEEGNIKELDTCSQRHLVYNNRLLYELIDCYHGDLPHIIEINWKENGTKISFDDFSSGIYKDGIKVKFDKKMNGNTINENTFLFMVKMEESETGNYRYEQVPGEVTYNDSETTATFAIESAWLVDVYLGHSRIREEGGKFMVVLRGDFILSAAEDCKPAKALDGNFIGGRLPSGNGTQGGDFVSWFSVGPKPEEEKGQKKRK